jgi:hypothetical protein
MSRGGTARLSGDNYHGAEVADAVEAMLRYGRLVDLLIRP